MSVDAGSVAPGFSPAVLLIGCGSIGQRHIRNLRALGVERVRAFDPDPVRRSEAATAGAETADDIDRAFAERPEAALICTPPHLHVAMACRALAAGAHLFIEKPIAATLDGVDELIAGADREGRVLAVGYNLRFHWAVERLKQLLDEGAIGRLLLLHAEVGQYLPDWRPGRDYRRDYTARADMGGGIILDASHEIDYTRWLAGEVDGVSAMAERLSDLDMDVEDSALLTLRFASGALGQLHLDCVQRVYARGCKLVGTEGTLTWEYGGAVRLYSTRRNEWETFNVAAHANQMYLDEMRCFLACVHGQARPRVTGEDARRVLEIALAARQAAMERREIDVHRKGRD